MLAIFTKAKCMTNQLFRLGVLAFILTLCSIMALAHATERHAKVGKHLTIALARITITPAEEIYTYAIPKQLGYFDKEGLDITILPTDGSTAALQAVASGSADIAYASSANIAAAIDKGVPLKAFAGLTNAWPYYIGVLQGSSIKTIADLKGKKIGVISLASASYNDLIANLKLAGLELSDVTIIPIGAGARAAGALKAGDVDAVDSYIDSFTIIQHNGVELTLLERPSALNKLFSVTMVTSQKFLASEPELLAKFARAAYEGIIYTKLFPESALHYAFKEFPQLLGANDPNGADAQQTKEALAVALSYSVPSGQDNPLFWGQWLNLSPDRWQAVLDFAYESGLTAKRQTVDDVWSDELMPEIYRFDPRTITIKPDEMD